VWRPYTSTMPPRHLDEVLAALERVAPLVPAHAAEADRTGTVPAELIDALFRERLFRLWIPADLDGDELGVPDSLEVFEAAARLDGAIGWLVTIGVGGGLFAATMERETAREVYLPSRALIAGSGAASGRAMREGDQYRVSGRWRYASGAHSASWFTANCQVIDSEEFGEPSVRAFAFPVEGVTVLDTWHVSGMRATGSHDFEVNDLLVPERYLFDVFGTPREEGSLYRFPFSSIAQASFAAVALGIARHALDVFHIEVPEHRRDAAGVLTAIEEASAAVVAAREALHAAVRNAWAQVERGDDVEEGIRHAIALAAFRASDASVRAAEQCYRLGGMAAAFEAGELNRAWRDVHTVSQHSALARPSDEAPWDMTAR